ncbi:hypothetical protein B484DRAFT_408012 [Ochromonadaceae sp. CCMP2298]|nr:hypothetical protein B484DRAFT_408012 [Ochromonadaceae sp. CCMP2298]
MAPVAFSQKHSQDERQTEDPQLAVRRRRDWFGTRTSTVLVHAGSPVPANGDTALANGGIVEASEGTDANGGNGGTGEGGSRFWLSERDLDPVQLTWSTASFSNS